MRALTPVLTGLLVAATACGPAPAPQIDTTTPGPLMRPGQDCGRCHSATSTGEVGPTWSAAGTIYADPQAEPLEGVEGVIVRLTDADGVVLEATTNEVGNFWFSSLLTPPLQVELIHDGRSTKMAGLAPSGYCAACHTAKDPLGPPGRVFIQ
jgi:mono/diheme cytochrome c family protein